MPIISAGVVNNTGRLLIARQFSEISRARIEGLFHVFPRLRDACVKKQATFLDAGSVRYVYQPMDGQLFLVLITTLNSNVIEDLSTLRLMSSVLSDTLTGYTVCEDEIEAKAFRILFAFDEIVVGGKRECASLEEVSTYLQMDSVDETLYLEKKEKLIEAAKNTTIEQARILKEKKMLGMVRSSYDPYSGFGSDGVMGEDGDGRSGSFFSQDLFSRLGNTDSDSGYSGGDYYNPPSSGLASSSAASERLFLAEKGGAPPSSQGGSDKPISGMALGRKGAGGGGGGGGFRAPLGGGGGGMDARGAGSGNTGANILNKIQREITAGPRPGAHTPGVGGPSGAVGASMDSGATTGPVHVAVKVEEKIMVTQTRDGDVSSAEVKGELSLVIEDARCERIMLELQVSEDGVFAFKPHPKLNKELFASRGVLAMSDSSKSFPVQQSITILQWKASPGVKLTPPLLFTCWPEIGRMTVEYELTPTFKACGLENVEVYLPLNGQEVSNLSATLGTAEVVPSLEAILWSFCPVPPGGRPPSQSSSSLDITLADGNAFCGDVFFPISVVFTAPRSLAQVAVARVLEVDTEMPVRFKQGIQLLAEKYFVE